MIGFSIGLYIGYYLFASEPPRECPEFLRPFLSPIVDFFSLLMQPIIDYFYDIQKQVETVFEMITQ